MERGAPFPAISPFAANKLAGNDRTIRCSKEDGEKGFGSVISLLVIIMR